MHHRGKKLRLRDWLVQKINEGKYGLRWVGDPKERTFRVPWKHGSRHGWSVDDAALFQAWALYTGKYKEGRDIPDPRKWKTNFRCALNALPDIKEIRGKSCPRGKDAFKIYRMTRPFRGREHHPPSLPVSQAAEIRRTRDAFQASRPFKESTFPVTMPYLPPPYPAIEPRYDAWQPRERRNSMGLTDDEIVNLVHEMMSEASSSPGLSTPGGSADSPYYGVNPFFP